MNLCIVYVSEAVRSSIISRFSSLVSPCLVHSFVDSQYNRTGFYLMHPNKLSLVDNALLLCREAVAELDFQTHTGTHPTLGVIDNICFSPIADESLDETVELARNFGLKLNEATDIPIYFYGAASPDRINLKDIRKSLGYFSLDKGESVSSGMAISPNIGTNPAPAVSGVSCVGAIPLIVNFNMRFRPQDKRGDIIKVTKAVRVPNVSIS